MTYTTVFRLVIAAFLLVTFSSGFSRHDVEEKVYLNLAAEKQFDCVGQVFKDNLAKGSCVLISDRIVLSAAHVFAEANNKYDPATINKQDNISNNSGTKGVTIPSRLYLVFNGQKVNVKSVIIHPNYRDNLTKGSCDIAILVLEEALTNIKPIALNRHLDEMNAVVVGVGFGASGPANHSELVGNYGKKIAGENRIDSIGGIKYSDVETLLLCDFDHPERKDCNKMGSPQPMPLEYICTGGDSGGGLFRQNGKDWELMGICSGGGTDIEQLLKTGYYGQVMQWTRVAAFINWIEENTK